MPHLSPQRTRCRQALRIIESYILLDGAALLHHHAAALSAALAAAAAAASERGLLLLLPTLQRAVADFPAAAPVALEAPLLRLLAAAFAGSETDLVRASQACQASQGLGFNPKRSVFSA